MKNICHLVQDGVNCGLFTEVDISIKPSGQTKQHFSFKSGVLQNTYNARLFDIASITKTFLTMLVYRLLPIGEEKFFSLDTPVHWHLNLDGPFVDELTFRHLLTFHATFNRFITPAEMLDEMTRRNSTAKLSVFYEMIQQMETVGLLDRPGVVHKYANIHSILLGRAIENAFGQNLEELLKTHLFKPLGLNDTLTNPISKADRCVIAGHGLNLGEVSDPVARLALRIYSRLLGSAGLFSTTSDMLKLLDVVLMGSQHPDCQIQDVYAESLHLPLVSGSNFGQGFGIWNEFRRNLEHRNPTSSLGGVFKSGWTGCMVMCSRESGVSFALATNFLHKDRSLEEMKHDRRLLNEFYAGIAECVLGYKND